MRTQTQPSSVNDRVITGTRPAATPGGHMLTLFTHMTNVHTFPPNPVILLQPPPSPFPSPRPSQHGGKLRGLVRGGIIYLPTNTHAVLPRYCSRIDSVCLLFQRVLRGTIDVQLPLADLCQKRNPPLPVCSILCSSNYADNYTDNADH